MADMWGRQEQVLAGGLSADRVFMTWPGLPSFGLGLMIQDVGVQYVQPVRRTFELGPGGVPVVLGNGVTGLDPINCDTGAGVNSPACANRVQATYYMVGRADGQMNFSQIVGPNPLTEFFYKTYGSPCAANVLSLGGRVACTAGGAASVLTRWVMTGVLLGQYQMRVSAAESFIQAGVGANFCNLFISTTP